ncbi:MAG: DUF2171 domain-containing protein [Hyphomonadaceae bacterium]
MIESTQIREHMEVVGSDDKHIGKVDHVVGNEIQLTKSMGIGKHHFLPLNLVARVDDKVRLSVTEDMAKRQWREMN